MSEAPRSAKDRLPAPDDFTDATNKRKREILTHLRGLVNHPGWVYIRGVLESQAEQRYLTIGKMQPLKIEDFLTQIALRAEAQMVEDLTSYPEFLIDGLSFDLGETEEEKEEEEDASDV